MRSRAVSGLVLALALALAAGACARDDPPMPGACRSTDAAGYERALGAAPAAVRLPGGVAISDCLRRARTDADLQDLGLVVQDVAERLATRARAGDLAAARSLGYLGGAAALGAHRSSGTSAELARRISSAATSIATGPPDAARALREGRDAGLELG